MRHTSGTLLVGSLITMVSGCNHAANPHSTLSGVYTTEQALRGAKTYGLVCESCHVGMGNHTGPAFRKRWGGGNVFDLYQFISYNMPKNDPGSLSPDEYADVTAYLLQMNGMPAGKTALATDSMVLKSLTYDTVATRR
jgi:mono/diheme cytochrome c family protein